MCLHLNHPAGDQVGPHEPAGDHLHELDVPLLRRLLWMLSASGFPGPPSQGPRLPQSLCLPGSPKSGAHLWVQQQQQHVQTGVAAAALLFTSFVRPPVTARPPQHSQALAVGAAGGGCQGSISKHQRNENKKPKETYKQIETTYKNLRKINRNQAWSSPGPPEELPISRGRP